MKTQVFVSLDNGPEQKMMDLQFVYTQAGQINAYGQQIPATVKTMKVRAVTDPDNSVAESNESNNQSILRRIRNSAAHVDDDMTLQDAGEVQLERVLWMYRDRVKDLKRDLKIRNVVVTRRYGKPGSVIRHPYTRILGAPIVFDDLRTELTQAREYYAYKRRCVFCDTIREEAASGDRMLQMTSHFAAFVPYAARVPFELRVLPRRHESAFEAITSDEVADLARLLKNLAGLLVKAIGDPSYRITLHTAPNLAVKIVQGEWDTIERDYHWHLEILVYPERAMWVAGIAVTDMLPEEAARILREAGSLEP
jgi:UDPglucose--hexose-1-phosphate uridylyltransferase